MDRRRFEGFGGDGYMGRRFSSGRPELPMDRRRSEEFGGGGYMGRRFSSGRPELPSLFDLNPGFGGLPYTRRHDMGRRFDEPTRGMDQDRFMGRDFNERGSGQMRNRSMNDLLNHYDMTDSLGANERSFSDYDPGFGNRKPKDDYVKNEILKELGECLVSSLTDGRSIHDNPIVRERLSYYMEAESSELGRLPPLAAIDRPSFNTDEPRSVRYGNTRGSYDDKEFTGRSFSNHDSYYESEFNPPLPNAFKPPIDRVSCGFTQDNSFSEYCHVSTTGGISKLTHRFHRVTNTTDPHRMWASEKELIDFFRGRQKIMDKKLKFRIKNTISFEITNEKNLRRRNWLNREYGFLMSARTTDSKSMGPISGPVLGVVRSKRKASIRKKEKKRLKDRRPVQSEKDKTQTLYLKHIAFSLADEEEHLVLLFRALITNKNIVKCLVVEVKQLLDKKFGSNVANEIINAKHKYVVDHRNTYWAETVEHFKKNPTLVGNLEQRKKYMEEIEPYIIGTATSAEYIATSEDYIEDPTKTEAQFVEDFKFHFIKYGVEAFKFKVVENFQVTKNIGKRNLFYMNNGFIAGLIVDAVMKNPTPPLLPGMAQKYITDMDQPCKDRFVKNDRAILNKLGLRNEIIQTDVKTIIGANLLQNDIIQKLKSCIELFDPRASIVKHILLYYTPFIKLSYDYKVDIFNEILHFIYEQCLQYIQNNVNTMSKQYVDMERDA